VVLGNGGDVGNAPGQKQARGHLHEGRREGAADDSGHSMDKLNIIPPGEMSGNKNEAFIFLKLNLHNGSSLKDEQGIANVRPERRIWYRPNLVPINEELCQTNQHIRPYESRVLKKKEKPKDAGDDYWKMLFGGGHAHQPKKSTVLYRTT